MTAAVGISGGWFDWRRGRMRRVPDAQLTGPVPVDHVAGNQLPFFLVGAVRDVGVFCDDLFFGFSELEFGLRLWRAGYTLYGYGPLWLESRKQTGRLHWSSALRAGCNRSTGATTTPSGTRSSSSGASDDRDGAAGHARAGSCEADRQRSAVSGSALTHLRLNVRAIAHGWIGRMGRRVDPDGGLRAGKARELTPIKESARMSATRPRTARTSTSVTVARKAAKVGVLPLGIAATSPGARCRDPRLSPGRGGRAEIDMQTSIFERQLDLLASLGEVRSLDDALRDGGAVVLTFDDGTRDFYERVLPLLAERQLPALLYLATAMHG